MSIATSLDKLSETLTNCKTNLKEKGVEADSIKISDVDEKIKEIQAGGGSTPFTYIDYIEFEGKQYKDNFSGATLTSYGDTKSSFKIKLKKDAYFCNKSSKLTVEPSPSRKYLSNTEYTFTIWENDIGNLNGLPFIFSEANGTYKTPDFFFIYYNYEGE